MLEGNDAVKAMVSKLLCEDVDLKEAHFRKEERKSLKSWMLVVL